VHPSGSSTLSRLRSVRRAKRNFTQY